MTYTVLARKYRPQTFGDLVGQEHVARTLSNAIETERVAHAFLFTGVRGVGKTTTARLLAKALNCEKGPTSAPCNQCDACHEIARGVDVDVQEIDGASNNSVDDVRRLQESLPFRPSRDRFKIIIIDEVHMLSTGAFNALLKTLEEPPDHVKFIFATTESHKIPITIRSRCQRYDFRLLSRDTISKRVKELLQKEGIEADEESLAIIATEAAGSMRDALTLLDQLIAVGGAKLDAQSISDTLGIAGRGILLQCVEALLVKKPANALNTISEAVDKGANLIHFSQQLSNAFRDLVVLKLKPDDKHIALSKDEVERYQELIKDVDITELERQFSGLSQIIGETSRMPDPRLALEMGLVRLASRPQLQDVRKLIEKIDEIEKKFSRAAVAPIASAPVAHAKQVKTPKAAPQAEAVLTPASNRALKAPQASPPLKENANQEDKESKSEPTTSTTEHKATEPGIRRAALLEWERMVDAVGEKHPALAAVLEHGIPRVVCAEEILVCFEEGSFYGRQAATPEATDVIKEVASKLLGGEPEISIRLDEEITSSGKTVAAVGAQRKEAQTEARKREALNHPSVLDALEVFPESASNVDVFLDQES